MKKKNNPLSEFNPFRVATVTLILCKLNGAIEWSWGWIILIALILFGIDIYREL